MLLLHSSRIQFSNDPLLLSFLWILWFPFTSQKHGNRWIGQCNLSLGMNECVNVCMHGALHSHLMYTIPAITLSWIRQISEDGSKFWWGSQLTQNIAKNPEKTNAHQTQDQIQDPRDVTGFPNDERRKSFFLYNSKLFFHPGRPLLHGLVCLHIMMNRTTR